MARGVDHGNYWCREWVRDYFYSITITKNEFMHDSSIVYTIDAYTRDKL